MKHLTAQEIELYHGSILTTGLPGVRAGLSVTTIVSRIDNSIYYEDIQTLIEIAALYADTIAKGHIFNDGNKRTAFVCMESFLEMNGYRLASPDETIADQIVLLADTDYDRHQLGAWLVTRVLAI